MMQFFRNVGFITLVLACASPALSQTNLGLLLHPDYKPLTAKQRWQLYLREAYASPAPYVAALGVAGLDQAHKNPPEWGQTASGYAKRVPSEFGQITLNETVHQGLAAAMGLEPRYVRCECKGFLPRTGHAIKMSFLNQGRTRIDLPSMAGAYAGGMISQYWYPGRFNPLTDGVREGTHEFAIHIGLDVIREFTPELRHGMHLKR